MIRSHVAFIAAWGCIRPHTELADMSLTVKSGCVTQLSQVKQNADVDSSVKLRRFLTFSISRIFLIQCPFPFDVSISVRWPTPSLTVWQWSSVRFTERYVWSEKIATWRASCSEVPRATTRMPHITNLLLVITDSLDLSFLGHHSLWKWWTFSKHALLTKHAFFKYSWFIFNNITKERWSLAHAH